MSRIRALAFAAAGTFLVQVALPAYADDSDEIAAIEAAIDRVHQAFTVGDRAAIVTMLTPEHLAATPAHGMVDGKAVRFDERGPVMDRVQTKSWQPGPFDISLLGDDVALVRFEIDLDATYQGTKLPERAFVTEVWVKRDGQWLQHTYQETALVRW